MLVFYSGFGRWHDGREWITGIVEANGVFLLTNRSRLEIKHKKRAMVTVMERCFNHEDSANSLGVNGLNVEDDREFFYIYTTLGDEPSPHEVLFTDKEIIRPESRNIQLISNEISEPERNSLLKLIYGMAKAKYDYSPNEDTRSTATGIKKGSIYSDLSAVDLNMDVKTIRKYLKEAVEKYG